MAVSVEAWGRSRQLALFVEDLYSEVLIKFLAKPKYIGKQPSWLHTIQTHPVLEPIWRDVDVPFTVFLMRVLPNERVFRYYPLELQHPCLRAFQNAQDVLRPVRIPWGLGVVSELLKHPYTFRSGNLFGDERVVYKRQDVRQGNRAIVMAAWPAAEDPQWVLGAYSPVQDFFDSSDLILLSDYLQKCESKFVSLNRDIVSDSIRYLRNDFETLRTSLTWRAFAAFLDKLDFLPLTSVEVLRSDEKKKHRDLISLDLNPYLFRQEVLASLENPNDIQDRTDRVTQVHKSFWHPLDGNGGVCCSPVQVDEYRFLLVRHNPDMSLPAVTMNGTENLENYERSLQHICLGLTPNLETDPLFLLAQDENVHSLTLIEVGRSHPELLPYPSDLCANGTADDYRVVDPPMGVLFHVEAYCGANRQLKTWASDLMRSYNHHTGQPFIKGPIELLKVEHGRYEASLAFSARTKLLAETEELLLSEMAEHLENVARAADIVHPDAVVNDAILFYQLPEILNWPFRCWHHDHLKPGDPSYERACQWLHLDSKDASSRVAVKALLRYHPPLSRSSTGSEYAIYREDRDFTSCTESHLRDEESPGYFGNTVAQKVFERFGMTVTINSSTEIYFPTQPAFPFFTSLRAFVSVLREEETIRVNEEFLLDKLQFEGEAIYVLTLKRGVDPRTLGYRFGGTEAAALCRPMTTDIATKALGRDNLPTQHQELPLGDPTHTVASSLIALQRCATHNADIARIMHSQLGLLFCGVQLPVTNIHFWPAASAIRAGRAWQLRIVWKGPK